jgi:hypothetical protein
MCVTYEGCMIVKAWSAPGGWIGEGGRGPGGGRVDQSPVRAGSPMVSCGRAAQSSWRPLHPKAMTHTERALGRLPGYEVGAG